MSGTITREAYSELIEEDIAALPEDMPNLERWHIIAVLRDSIDRIYAPSADEEDRREPKEMIEIREDFVSELAEVVEVGAEGTKLSLGHYVETRGGRFVVIPRHHRNFPPSEVRTKEAAIEVLKQPTPKP